LPIYARSDVLENLKERFEYIFRTANKYWGAPDLQPVEISDKPFTIKAIELLPVEVLHGKLAINAFRIGDFAYITDMKSIRKEESDKLKGLHTLVVNVLRKEPHPTHMNLEEALDFISEIKPERTFLTHISHRLGFHRKISAELPENVFLAYDGLQVSV
jgi:phosphoribosyl 1,2-cyclic phosphate phosphodiesterase